MTGISLALAAAAVLAGSSLFSILGQGGGVVYVPVLIALGMSVHQAAATSLFVILATSLSAVVIFGRRRMVDWKLVLAIEPTTFALSFAGGLTASYVDAVVLQVVFGGTLILASPFMMRPAVEKDMSSPGGWGQWHRTVGDRSYAVQLPWLIPVSGAAGFVAGMIGVAGGVFKMPAMVLLGGIPIRIAVGSSSVMVALTALAGLCGHLTTGSFDIWTALPLAAAALVGGRLGSSVSVRVEPAILRLLFAILLLLVAAWMIVSAVV